MNNYFCCIAYIYTYILCFPQSYGRRSDRRKEQQAFVASVAPGSPAYMAGMYPGDAIIEVNGQDLRHASADEVVEAIMSTAGKRAHIVVEYVDGTRRIQLRKQLSMLQQSLTQKQHRLLELLASGLCQTSYKISTFPVKVNPALSLRSWNESDMVPAVVSTDPHPFACSPELNQLVCVYSEDILKLSCDVLVMPVNSRGMADPSENTITKLLHAGGDKLINEICLARQPALGEILITSAGDRLGFTCIYHCIFGDLEEHVFTSCSSALTTAAENRFSTIAFWIDGFMSVGISPQLVLDAIRTWLQEERNALKFDRVVLSLHSFPTMLEVVEKYFPIQPCAVDSLVTGSN